MIISRIRLASSKGSLSPHSILLSGRVYRSLIEVCTLLIPCCEVLVLPDTAFYIFDLIGTSLGPVLGATGSINILCLLSSTY